MYEALAPRSVDWRVPAILASRLWFSVRFDEVNIEIDKLELGLVDYFAFIQVNE